MYAIAYTIRMSYKGARDIEAFFQFVVLSLEGMWWLSDGSAGMDYADKSRLVFISMLRLPEFVTAEVFEWAKNEALNKKGVDTSKAELLVIDEGLCAQILHLGAYDDEPEKLKTIIRHPIKDQL